MKHETIFDELYALTETTEKFDESPAFLCGVLCCTNGFGDLVLEHCVSGSAIVSNSDGLCEFLQSVGISPARFLQAIAAWNWVWAVLVDKF
jgi:hypothetical protein